ncbi:tRNA lysidine(34) synthetase TilS [Isachenkonia alkalipeptolytica]|uniref:tRNA(Ile)-lysidine synthase n=1 Tax=Isachenkonia alkalipeptolytica TaxID=2565777 RepID=A0AA43XKZ3_9CLOT|nr:tRNA lysidine(34) synthetase TilS [Isachenkonia alkalipeptolytica]
MVKQLLNTIDEHRLLKAEDKIVVAVSGGPDSVTLLHLLHRLKSRLGIEVYGAHLNHNIRGIDAQMDAQYVLNLCEELDIICFVKSMDVQTYAKEQQLTSEQAGRILRYEFFEEVLKKVGASKIAVGHNKNDQAETVLMRLLRGTGMQGLTAIQYKRDQVIRPLLDVSRGEIEAYCNDHNLAPRTDQTNLTSIYHRNKIRRELIPYLEENYNPSVLQSLVKTANILKEDYDYLEQEGEGRYKELVCFEKKDQVSFSIPALEKQHPAIKARILRRAGEELLGRGELLSYQQVQNLLGLLAKKATGKALHLPMNLEAFISYDKLIFTRGSKEDVESFKEELAVGEITYVHPLKASFELKVFSKDEVSKVSRDKFVKYFDYDKIKGKILVRNRREGDRFWPLGLSGKKKLKDFLIDCKVDRRERDLIPLICHEKDILWVVGYRISDKYKVTEETQRILSIRLVK